MEIAIRVESLAKEYQLGVINRQTLTTELSSWWNRVRGRERPATAAGPVQNGKFWALRDVSFEVNQGEVVGIIGRNGAGKSTLLKILSGITAPTRGRAYLNGRVASLLEVGTGFHKELTGRENIYLNGSILGMNRRELDGKFDEIVAFSGVEKFIDTPVKRYSSGMGVRLAFAVAAHLDPEILILDEVLTVGDASFQKKCLNKMEDVSRQGRTVIFVSHDMQAVTRLCPRAILLSEGCVVAEGPSHQIVTEYLRSGVGSTAAREWTETERGPGNENARLCAMRVRNHAGAITETCDIRQPIALEMEFEVLQPNYVLAPNFHVFNEDGVCVFVVTDNDPVWRKRPRPTGRYVSRAIIPGNFLAEGSFIVTIALSTLDPVIVHFRERDAVAFQVIDSLDGDSVRGDFAGRLPGVVRPLLEWQTQFTPSTSTP